MRRRPREAGGAVHVLDKHRTTGASTMTCTLLGILRSDARSRGEFLALSGAAH
ncbi:hypothetical protein ACIPWE_20645 [Streptomyces sp. NPDC090073]|uniref:hypothetical protein n=1 Tax=Streptomyces sp. NPDC090073 TaxID=3365936 RepID=UPI003810BC65